MIEITRELFTGIVIGMILTFLLTPSLKKLFGRKKRPFIDIRTFSELPSMNSTDLTICVSGLINEPGSKYTLNKITPQDKDGYVTIWVNSADQDPPEISFRCKVDDTLPNKYPLSYHRKKL